MESIVVSLSDKIELCSMSDTFVIKKGDQVITFIKSKDSILIKEEVNYNYLHHLYKNA